MARSLFAVEELRGIWDRIVQDDLADGVPSHGVERFGDDADERLARLSEQLEGDLWKPHALAETTLPGIKRRVPTSPPSRIGSSLGGSSRS